VANAVDRDKIHTEGAYHCFFIFSWLEGYLEQLEGKEALREYQERHYDIPEYYELVAALMA
jgi:hypothetical protein